MTHGDGRFASRFRPNHDPTTLPRVVGLCVSCLRPMWSHIYRAAPYPRAVTVSTDKRHCNPCYRYIQETGCDPQTKKGSAAERIPAEMPEPDDSWRYRPNGPACRDTDPLAFIPDPLPEDLAAIPERERESTLELRRFVAEHVCGPCPVRRECGATADACGFEGLWGGRFFTRTRWTNLVTGVAGPTRHTSKKERERLLLALSTAGLGADGEPVPDGNLAAS